MFFHLPSNLESFIPPPSEQRPQPPPWRGSIVISGMGSSGQSSTQEISITAVETDGEKYVDAWPMKCKLTWTHPSRAQQWPATFYVRVAHKRPVLRDMQAWVKECVPPLPICTFMPDRLREQNANTVNQTNFRSLSRTLFENQTVAVAPWGTNVFPGAGIIIYPAQNSTAILVGALFFLNAFPSFVDGVLSSNFPVSPNVIQSSRHTQHQHRIVTVSHFGSSQHRPSLYPHKTDPDSPVEPFHYVMHRDSNLAAYPDLGQGASSTEAAWSNVKANDKDGYGTPHENPPYP